MPWGRTIRSLIGRAGRVAAVALGLVPGCAESGNRQASPDAPAAQVPGRGQTVDSVALTVVFTRDERPAHVHRRVPADSANLRTALRLLLAGPTVDERAAGITSWFSDATRDALRGVTVTNEGTAIVDLRDIRRTIPGASSSAGGAMLLQELNGTVFQFPEVVAADYRIDGSCDVFWDWLQYGCQQVRRSDVQPAP